MKKIILVDGSSYLFRAYHGMPPLVNAKNQPTGAIYGVISMINKLIKEEKPDYFAIIFDSKGKTFRHDLYPDYKSHRPPMDVELASQIPYLHQIIQAMGIPLITMVGVEADDIIGTLALQAKNQHCHIIISTGDKDFAQLVDQQITLVNTMNNTILDIEGVQKKFGVPPHQIKDYLALIGDRVDNIPGVPSVGPKTAVKWLIEYGSLENIIHHADNIKGAVGNKLRAHLSDVRLAYELVTIKQDIELSSPLCELIISTPNDEALYALYEELEFKTWLQKPKKNIENIILTIESFPSFVSQASKNKSFAFDISDSNSDSDSDSDQIFSFAFNTTTAYSLSNKPAILTDLKSLLENKDIKKIVHNAKAIIQRLQIYDIKLHNLEDIMLESYIIHSTKTRHTIEAMAATYLPTHTIRVIEILSLHQILWPKLLNEPTLLALYENIEKPLLFVLNQMENQGVKINPDLLNTQSQELGERMALLESQAHLLANKTFNLSSPKQLQEILYTQLAIPVVVKTPTGQPSTSERVLEALSHHYALPGIILTHRSLSKLKSTYTDKLPLLINPGTHRIHTSYHQAITATGRLSSSDPNLQNIPIRTAEGRRIRQAFIAEPNFHLLSVDYSQIELRIMASFSLDPTLLHAFQTHQDIHQFTASELLGIPLQTVSTEQRRAAKTINFGLIYGMSAFGLARQLSISQQEAADYMAQYFQRYPGVKAYMAAMKMLAFEQGFVETLQGRRLYLPDIYSKNITKKRAAQRMAINAPLQGTAADLIKIVMIKLYDTLHASNLQEKIKIIMQVHDELVFEVRDDYLAEASLLIKDIMENTVKLSIPLEVSIGAGLNWDQAH